MLSPEQTIGPPSLKAGPEFGASICSLGHPGTTQENLSLSSVIMSNFLPKQRFSPSFAINLNSESINIKDVIVLRACKMFHTFTLSLLCGQTAMASLTFRDENYPKEYSTAVKEMPEEISVHSEQWGCHYNKKVLSRKVFSFKRMKNNRFHCSIVTLCLGECRKDGEGQESNNTVSRNSKTQGGLHSNHSPMLPDFSTWDGLVFAPK